MKTGEKIVALILAIILVFSFSSCRKNGKEAVQPAQSSALPSLPYSSADLLDPYSSKSETNIMLSQLIYDSLFTIKADRTAAENLVQSVVTQEKIITVKLRPTKFSDGSALTADDVIFSFDRAKQSELYKNALKDFDSAERKGASVVRFTLAVKNVYALNLLTFPIVSQRDNSIGSGMYMLSEKNGQYMLEYNKNHEGSKPKIEKFALCECKDYSNAANLFNDGKIDYLFDTLESGNLRSSSIQSSVAKMNNFVFLGLNSKKGAFKNVHFRAAVSLALNQTELCEQALEGYAFPTATPFDSEWSEIGSVVSNSVLSKDSEAKEEFLNSGCTYDKMGINLLSDDEQITLNLIVNSANNMKIALAELIKTELINFGISVEIKKMPLDEYNIAVENGNFDMYIGEVKIPNDFNLDCFFTEGGGADFGIKSSKVQKTYLLFKGGNATLQEFVSVFSAENPFVPICYKGAEVCCSSSLKISGGISENDIYSSIEEWSY